MTPSRVSSCLVVTLLLVLGATSSPSARQSIGQQIAALNWIKGPTSTSMFGVASIQIPSGYMLLGPTDADKFMALTENVSSGSIFVFAPDDLHWWSEMAFSHSGYVKDDEKIDPVAILRTVTKATEEANKERRAKGWSPMTVMGWKLSPFYDAESKRLEWAIRGKSDAEDSESINFNTRILGRSGVTSATLIVEADGFDAGVEEFKTALRSYDYSSGERYFEFRAGDKVAEYGLTALIVGGAAAVATKTGFWKLLGVFFVAAWKLVLGAIVALFAAIAKMFKRKNKQ